MGAGCVLIIQYVFLLSSNTFIMPDVHRCRNVQKCQIRQSTYVYRPISLLIFSATWNMKR